LSQPIIVDTGGLLRALARTPDFQPSFPEYQTVLTSASLVIVPALVLAEVDYFLRTQRAAMRKLIAETSAHSASALASHARSSCCRSRPDKAIAG